ncbi:MAG TPA: SNF2 helicase associated domain-containing protein, partial [Armatimonadota bacterium]|nr:SNF2 helicase associated domain-containing protein [Armatimonadota bacterium]
MDWKLMTLAEDDMSPTTPQIVNMEHVDTHGSEDMQYGPHLSTLTRESVEALADSPIIFRRGDLYFSSGSVRQFSVADMQITARVQGGSSDYAVDIQDTEDGLQMSCTCPYDGEVCKHLVAVLLKFIEYRRAEDEPDDATPSPGPMQPISRTNNMSALIRNLRSRRYEREEQSGISQRHPQRSLRRRGLLAIFSQASNLSALFARTTFQIEQAGKLLFIREQVVMENADDDYADFEVRDLNGRLAKVSIANGNDTMRGVTMTCTCPAGRRGAHTTCEHMVAAAYLLQQHAIQTVSPQNTAEQWEESLTYLLADGKIAKARKARSLLLFSLQERATGGWKLVPYSMPTSLFDADILDDRAALRDAIVQLDRYYDVKELSYYNPPVDMLYATPELRSMAQLVCMANYYLSGDPLAFALPQMRDALLFRGTSDVDTPFIEPITLIDPEPRALQLMLQDDDTGTRLTPAIPDNGGRYLLLPEVTRVVSMDPLWVLAGDRLLRIEGDGKLLNGLLETREILIPKSAKGTFVTRYLPKLIDRTQVAGDGVEQSEGIDTAPIPRVYLNEEQESIVAELMFSYDDYEVALDTSWPKTALQIDEESELLITILRRCEDEENAWRRMSDFGLKRDNDRFVLKQRVSPIDFLLNHLPRMQAAGYEIYGEDTIKSTRVNHNQPQMRMVVSSGIDWFDILAVVMYGEQEVRLSEVRKALKKRQGYVKLPDGSLGILPEEWFAQYRSIFTMGETTEEGVRLSKTQAMLLELILKSVETAQVDAEYTRHVERLRSFKQIETRPLPEGFNGELRPYQRAGFDWLHFLHDYGFGGCLADDMGIGKTVQTLVFLQSLYAANHTTAASLIVMPRSLIENWAREAARFTPDLKVLIHADGDRSADATLFDQYHLVLTTYGVMLR